MEFEFVSIAAYDGNLINALEAENLPVSDLGKDDQSFWALSVKRKIVGYAGLEQYGEAGLVRSIVILPDYKGQGFGTRLVTEILDAASILNIKDAWLLTTTAQDFFKHQGWQIRARADAPLLVAQSDEFAGICPSSAVCMSIKV